MFLKYLARQDLGKDVGRVDRRRHQLNSYDPSAAQLAHLKQLAIDMPRVLGRSEAVTQIVRPLVIGAGGDGSLAPVEPTCSSIASVWMTSMASSASATSSASHDDMVMQCCRREQELMPALARNEITNPVVDRRSDQFESRRGRGACRRRARSPNTGCRDVWCGRGTRARGRGTCRAAQLETSAHCRLPRSPIAASISGRYLDACGSAP